MDAEIVLHRSRDIRLVLNDISEDSCKQIMKLFKIPLLTLKMWCVFLVANSHFVFTWSCISAKKSVRRFRSSWL